MPPTLIVLEGADGTGKTTHTTRLAEALTARGHAARAWHHPPPRTDTSYAQRAQHFADARSRFLAETAIMHPEVAVWVLDRWLESTVAALPDELDAGARRDILALVLRERAALPPVYTVLLDATHAALDARLLARGDALFDARYAVRHRYGVLAIEQGWPTVRTDDDADAVNARLVAHLVRARVLAPRRREGE